MRGLDSHNRTLIDYYFLFSCTEKFQNSNIRLIQWNLVTKFFIRLKIPLEVFYVNSPGVLGRKRFEQTNCDTKEVHEVGSVVCHCLLHLVCTLWWVEYNPFLNISKSFFNQHPFMSLNFLCIKYNYTFSTNNKISLYIYICLKTKLKLCHL